MRRIFTFFVIALSLKAANSGAQVVPNLNFEQLNFDGSLSYWGNVYLFSAWFDSSGVSHSVDSIVYDGQFMYAPTNDAYSGNTALELRNAWNYTTNTFIAGAVGSDDDTVFSAYGLLNLLPTYGTPSNPFEPIDYTFYYKFHPVNGDSASVQIVLWDSIGNQMAEGLVVITDSASNYTLMTVPINYSITGGAAYYSFTIRNFYSIEPGSHQPSLGTRFIVDSININYFSSTGINSANGNRQMNVYPNPARDHIRIDARFNKSGTYKIHSVIGQKVLEGNLQANINTIDLNGFENGIYILEINSEEKSEFHTIIVNTK
jgi:hypothetical protein